MNVAVENSVSVDFIVETVSEWILQFKQCQHGYYSLVTLITTGGLVVEVTVAVVQAKIHADAALVNFKRLLKATDELRLYRLMQQDLIRNLLREVM